MFKKNDKVFLTGKTGHGKNRVREQGNPWTVDRVQSSKILINKDTNWKWIDLPADRDYEIILEIEYAE